VSWRIGDNDIATGRQVLQSGLNFLGFAGHDYWNLYPCFAKPGGRGILLAVGIEKPDFYPNVIKPNGKVSSQRRFRDATFSVDECNDECHGLKLARLGQPGKPLFGSFAGWAFFASFYCWLGQLGKRIRGTWRFKYQLQPGTDMLVKRTSFTRTKRSGAD
jgi:hypothetical protein